MNVLITGASGGLGRALANECAKGYNLFSWDINEQGLKSIKSLRAKSACVART
jgi:short-subunit dehydrogenase